MLNEIVEAYHRTARIERDEIFPDANLMPVTRPEDAATSAPGWVGARWKPGGTLLMAINPGGGGDAYRLNATDDTLYGSFRAFRAASVDDRVELLARLSRIWIDVQKTHNLHRLVREVLDALDADEDDVAFLNMLPFRTRNDKPAGSAILRRAWSAATEHQVAALRPGRIVALGRKAFDALVAVGADSDHEIVYLKRSIGDSYVTPEAQAAIATLRDGR